MAAVSLSLARCVEAVARLLDGCGPLEPVRLCMSEGDVQAEVCARAGRLREHGAAGSGDGQRRGRPDRRS